MTKIKSIVEVEVEVPQHELAELLADPRNHAKWMHDLERSEPVSGRPGLPGSTFRLVPKEGEMVFLATVLKRSSPDELRFSLQGTGVDVSITDTLIALSPTRTKLISKEVFTFTDPDEAPASSSVKNAIRAEHRRHIEDLKRFAEHGW